MKQYLIRFYDDDKNNFVGNKSDNIECILIDDKNPHPLIKKKNIILNYYFFRIC